MLRKTINLDIYKSLEYGIFKGFMEVFKST